MISDDEADRIDRLRNLHDEMAKIGPRLPDRSFELTDWTNNTSRWPLLILEYIDGGLDSIYGPYTNTADILAALRHLDPEGDDGYWYDLQPLKGKI